MTILLVYKLYTLVYNIFFSNILYNNNFEFKRDLYNITDRKRHAAIPDGWHTFVY